MGRHSVEIGKLTAAERLELLERIWDSLTPDEMPLTEAQRAELDRRLDELDRDKTPGIPWDEVLRRIRDKDR